MEIKQNTLKQSGQRRIKRKTRKYLQTNTNQNTTYQYLWDAMKTVLRREFIAIITYNRKEEISQLNFVPQGTKKNKLNVKLGEGKKKNQKSEQIKQSREQENNRKNQWN